MPMALCRLPIKVRLNRSFFPVDLISIRTRRGCVLDGVHVMQVTTDDIFKARGGGGGGPTSLGPVASIDVFVRDEELRSTDPPPLEHALFMHVRRGAPGVLDISWEQVNGEDSPGNVCIIWSHEDRVSGLRPIIAVGSAAEALSNYLHNRASPLSAILLGIRGRIREMGHGDIRERLVQERKVWGSEMDTASRRVQSISIEGFRGFREEAVLRLAQPTGTAGSGLTFVVGANNTGKSTIWESFDALARKLKWDVSFSEGRRNRGAPAGIRLRLELAGGCTYTVTSRNPNTSETRDEWSPAQPMALPEIVSVPSRRQFQASFGRSSTSARDWMTTGQDFTRFRQNDEFTGRLFDLHNDEKKKATFDELMAKVLGHELSWTIDLGDGQHGQSYYLKVTTGDGVNHTSEGLGDGIISLLYILNALYDSEPGTLLVLDEPELSLHPQAVRRLGRVLANFSADRQIVVFTHSVQLLSWNDVEQGAEIARVYKMGADSKIAQAGRATINEVSKARGGWRNPHTLGIDANEAFFLDDGVIVVEGQEDAALLPVVFRLADVPAAGTVFGWGSGGEGNVSRIANLLRDLGFQRVAIVLDNNVPDRVERLHRDYPEYHVATIPAADIRDKPARPTKEVQGLLDEHGKMLKPDLEDETKAVLSKVTSYLKGESVGHDLG